jgi:hypothetical protein
MLYTRFFFFEKKEFEIKKIKAPLPQEGRIAASSSDKWATTLEESISPASPPARKPSKAVEIAAAEEVAEVAKDDDEEDEAAPAAAATSAAPSLAALLHPSRSSASLPTSTATDAVVRAVRDALPPGSKGGEKEDEAAAGESICCRLGNFVVA